MTIILFFLLSSNFNEFSPKITHGDLIELNHCYDDKAAIKYHQIILYQWENYRNKENIVRPELKVVFTLILNRKEVEEKLTEEEYKLKNREFGDAWIKKYGFTRFIPDYNPKFYGNHLTPKYCVIRKLYETTFIYRKDCFVLQAPQYLETWTQYDPDKTWH